MYVIPQTQPKIKLISNNGDVAVYENYQKFIETTSYYFVERCVVTTFRELPSKWLWVYLNELSDTLYIVRDSFGSVFSPTEILHDIKEYNITKHKEEYNARYNFVFRSTPVPFTGVKRWKFRNFYKRPKTAQERRWNMAHKKYARGRRSKKYLPDSWWDIPRSDSFVKRSWKKNKKKRQWM